MRASINDVTRLFESLTMGGSKCVFYREQHLKLSRILLIGAIAGIVLAHGIVLYKIDSGVRSSDVKQVMASRSHRAFW
jgi:hypothetical protein